MVASYQLINMSVVFDPRRLQEVDRARPEPGVWGSTERYKKRGPLDVKCPDDLKLGTR